MLPLLLGEKTLHTVSLQKFVKEKYLLILRMINNGNFDHESQQREAVRKQVELI